MYIALIGYGKMGKEIEQVALSRNHTISLIIDLNNADEFTTRNLEKAQVAIEFSNPDSVVENIHKCFEANIPVVCGTTGWGAHFETIKSECLASGNTLFYSSNYSLGVNVFFKLNLFLAKIMNQFPQYDVEIEETHHIQKLDAPSGTAITLAHDIIKLIDRKNHWQLNRQDHPDDIKIKAIRRDMVPGIHTIKYDSSVDSIEITHDSKNRKGLALGAVLAAEFIAGKIGVFSMDDMLKF